MAKFNDPVLDERAEFIKKFFEERCIGTEDIRIGVDNQREINLFYRTVKNSVYYEGDISLPIFLFVIMNHSTSVAVLMDVLTWFRNNAGEAKK